MLFRRFQTPTVLDFDRVILHGSHLSRAEPSRAVLPSVYHLASLDVIALSCLGVQVDCS